MNSYQNNKSPIFYCNSISRYYLNEPVIEDISLALNQGELISLVGPSGVGKTTLFNILAGVDTPDHGEVFLSGKKITGTSGKVGYMLQKDLLFPYKTTLDNVILPLVIAGTPTAKAKEKAGEHLAAFGLSGYGDKYPHQLSGGMRQRAALLRTFLMGSPVTLLDEPFSALDTLTKSEMHSWYLNLVKTTGMTSLFITHDIDEALYLSDRIYVLAGKPGKIATVILVPEEKPRPRDFFASQGFVEKKKEILRQIRQTIEL